MGQVAQLVARGGRHDLVELAASQGTSPVGDRVDRAEDRPAQAQGEPQGQGHRADQRDDHQPDRCGCVLAGPTVHRLHILLIQSQDLVRILPDLVEGRLELASVDLGPSPGRLGGEREEAIRRGLVLAEEALQGVGGLLLALDRDVSQLGLQVVFEEGPIPVELLLTPIGPAVNREGMTGVDPLDDLEEQAGIHPLDRLFHPLGRQHAPEVLAKDHINIIPKSIKHDDSPESERHQYRQRRQEPDE